MTEPHRFYAVKRDGILHPTTICDTDKAAMELGRVYCCNYLRDSMDGAIPGKKIWQHLLDTGRVEVVALECREVPA